MTELRTTTHGCAARGPEAPRLTTARLALRPVEPADAPALTALFGTPYVRRYLFDDQAMGEAWVAARIGESAAMFRERGFGLWLFGRPGEAALGFAGFILHEGEPTLMYGQGEDAAGQGFAREAAEAVLRHAAVHGLGPVRATVDEANVRSRRLLEALGFSQHRNEGAVLYLERPG